MMHEHDTLGERCLSTFRMRYGDEEADYHSIYIGLPRPHSNQKKRRKRRSSFSQDKNGECKRPYKQQIHSDTEEGRRTGDVSGNDHASRTMSPAAERLRYILGEDDDPPNPTLFTEMDTLQRDGEEMEWKEAARWIKFEEKVEEGGERWSKPHVSTLTLHSLFELRTCLQMGTILLDLDGYFLPQIIDNVIEKQIEDGLLKPELREKISYVLLRKHRHQMKKSIHRSLADIGKSVSSINRSPVQNPATGAGFYCSSEDLRIRQNSAYGRLRHTQSRSMNDITDTPSTAQLRNKFMKKIPKNAEASNVLVGEVDFLDKPFVAFVRLIQSTMLGGMTEVPIPTRFLFILLGPSGKAKSYNEIGRAIATLLVDDLFSDVAYKARDREDLIAGLDEFLDEVTVLPPGGWDPNVRIEPPKKLPSAEKRKSVFSLSEATQMNGAAGGAAGGGGGGSEEDLPAVHDIGEELMWTGRFCGGLYLDLKRKLPWFPSDFYDGFHIQSISAVLFIYLGCIANAITFGGLLGDATDNYQGVMESFLGTAIAGSMFCLLAGQPLIILSSTGPILIFEKLLYDFSKSNSIDYLEFRLWIGLHSAAQCLFLVATDASFIIKYITRFTEEGFSTLISFIFIYDAIKKMIGAFKVYPINVDYNPDYVTMYKCECVAPDAANTTLFNASVPLVPNNVNISMFRKFISDFSIFMSILMFVGLDVLCGLNTPKLQVPTEFKPTRLDRGWFVFPFGKNPWWIYLASALPALLVTILIFMDQQITAVIVNRKEHKLKKASGYHLDLFWVGVLLAVCSFMGLPWYVAATVISIAHIDSLKMETETSAPGEQPQFLGVREQRVTGIVVFILTGISVFLAPILKYIPMPVLYGIFLYMGVASLNGIQFWERCKLFLMPAKHQPDYVYLRHVPLRKIHFFTTIQIVCLAILWIMKSTVAAIIFPVMILALILVRKMLDFVFSQHDLAWIDNIIPEKQKVDNKKKEKKKKGQRTEEQHPDEEKNLPVGVLHSDSSPNNSDPDHSITLHLKISCPSSPAFSYSRSPVCTVPQVKIEMGSNYEDTDTERQHPQDMGSETTL
ncbi:electrogenic sodium bicarbonate cotransporter 4 isoform X8 [Crotalus tigris]|uniref:electrogenic sodium bicarbonate cotransporter 4 isoform X8 n=1 Tax=Crotalus tigris TaxID=88082 RepID=UPI00192FA313|nr:electrogenic sodium bicarbonate cotransporter 4 isoform X8 [Crotalus tigris]